MQWGFRRWPSTNLWGGSILCSHQEFGYESIIKVSNFFCRKYSTVQSNKVGTVYSTIYSHVSYVFFMLKQIFSPLTLRSYVCAQFPWPKTFQHRSVPFFALKGLRPEYGYDIVLTAKSAKGRSAETIHHIYVSNGAEKHTGKCTGGNLLKYSSRNFRTVFLLNDWSLELDFYYF